MTDQSRYQECLKTMYGLRRFGIKLGLSTIRGILGALGNPQNNYACIHVAGTNGKGSIAATLASIFQRAGYKVGLYTSPHLVRFNERICVDGHQIADNDVVSAFRTVQAVHRGEREPTFFEFTTAMALVEFSRRQVDWAIIETGMGGRLDATNVIRPAACVISNISVEHQAYLGRTIAQIAAEKAGIIKPETPVITGVRQPSAVKVIQRIAEENSAPLFRLGKHFRFRRTAGGAFNYYGFAHTWRDLRPGLIGEFQVENAALASAVCETLLDTSTVMIGRKDIRTGLGWVRWPGRLEIVAQAPLMILDGAHNLAAARNLARFIKQHLGPRKLTLVIGILDDKPYAAMLKHLLPMCSRAIFTRPGIGRALPPATLARAAEGLIENVKIIPSVKDAVDDAVKTTSENDAICIAGSLYVVGEAKQWLENQPQ